MARGVINFSSKKKLCSATSKKKLARIPISLLSATGASNKALIPSLTSWNPSGVSGALLAHPKLGQVLVRRRPGVIEFFARRRALISKSVAGILALAIYSVSHCTNKIAIALHA